MTIQCFLRCYPVACFMTACRSMSNGPRKISYAYGMPRKPLVYKTIPQVLREAAEAWPGREHIVSVHQSLSKTFTQLYEDANRLASALLSIDVKKGDRIGIWAPNSYEWIIAHYGVAKVGGILVNVNPGYKEKELTHCVNLVSMSTLISSQKLKSSNYVSLLESASPGIFETSTTGIGVSSASLPSLKNVIYIDDADNEIAPQSYTRFWNFIQSNSSSEPCINYQLNPEDIWNIQFTSGTTGSPKGAALTHHGTVNNAIFCSLDFLQNITVCVPNPLYHCFGSVAGLLAGALQNNTIVLPASVSTASETLKAIEKYECHATFGTPTMYVDLIRENKTQETSVGKKSDLSSIQYIYMSGSPCPEKLTRDMKSKLFPQLKRVIIPYGTTEVSPVITLPRKDCPNDNYDYTTVGFPLDHSEVKIVNPSTGDALPIGEVGELWTRSVYVFPGYWNAKEKTAQVIDERAWYKTGDLAHMNEDGYLAISGRIKDMIIRGGENIYPREIEELILTHPSVLDVNVVGVPDDRMGEEIAACVILNKNFLPTDQLKDDIKSFCRDKISHFKVPRYILFMQDYPRTVTIKVQKNELQQIAASLIKEESPR